MRLRCLVFAPMLLAGCDQLFGLREIPPVPTTDAAPPCEPRSLSTGRDHTCVVNYRGRVTCWGGNSRGQVQAGGPYHVLLPTEIVLPMPATQVTTGRNFSCARLEDESVWCWGSNTSNELAAGADVDDSPPRRVEGIGPSAEVRGGGYHACSRRSTDGVIECWGGSRHGEVGQTGAGLDCNESSTSEDACYAPAAIPGTAGSKAVALGHRSSCLIDASDRVACWGKNSHSQLGFAGDDTAVPTVVSVLGPVTDLSASGRTTCAIATTGETACWGDGDDGQLATGTFGPDQSPPLVTQLQNARALALGGFGACALVDNGSITCWGTHDGGAGANTTTASPQPSLITGGARQLASHFFHTCAVVDSEVQCWGLDRDGQLGRGTRSVVTTPMDVPLAGVVSVTGGRAHVCARTGSDVYCWGENNYHQSGSTGLVEHYVPTKVETVDATALVAAFDQTCAVGGGGAQCWGRGGHGRLATGSSIRATPPTDANLPGVSHLALGNAHLCAVLGGTLRCFGNNTNGQLGVDRTATPSSTGGVTASGNLTGITGLTAGARHTCALTSVGALYCWGANSAGQLGNGGNSDTHTPQLVSGLSAVGVVSKVSAGENYTCAIAGATNELYCWGRNANGQLGISGRSDRNTPQKVPLSNVADVWTGGGTNTTCARVANGTVYCWGDGDYGQLGNGTAADAGSPQEVAAFANASDIAITGHGTCALVGETLRCTGETRLLGTDDRSDSVPTAVDLRLGACEP